MLTGLRTLKHKGLLKRGEGEARGWQLALLQVAEVLGRARRHKVQRAQQRAANHCQVPCWLLCLDLPVGQAHRPCETILREGWLASSTELRCTERLGLSVMYRHSQPGNEHATCKD